MKHTIISLVNWGYCACVVFMCVHFAWSECPDSHTWKGLIPPTHPHATIKKLRECGHKNVWSRRSLSLEKYITDPWTFRSMHPGLALQTHNKFKIDYSSNHAKKKKKKKNSDALPRLDHFNLDLTWACIGVHSCKWYLVCSLATKEQKIIVVLGNLTVFVCIWPEMKEQLLNANKLLEIMSIWNKLK